MATSLKVTIVGGGVGGLTTAVAMRRAGHNVTVSIWSIRVTCTRLFIRDTDC